jgi:glycosyltransferase involved in cell wall biosynthesis
MRNLAAANPRRTRTLMVSDDVLGDKMAGPGIRYYHLSRVLGRYTDLTLAIIPQDRRALAAIQARLPDVTVVSYERLDWNTIKEVAEWAEVVIVSPFTVGYLPQFVDHPGAVVLDGYDPLVSEWLLTISSEDLDQQISKWSEYLSALYNQYLVADFVICASERQRFWWFGQLELAGRINPLTFGDDRSLRNLVDIVPYGLPEIPPKHTKPGLKGVWPGIEEDDVVILWGGGLWPWLDPYTAVQAVNQLRKSHPELKLIFPGTIHPNQEIASSTLVRETETYRYAKEHGLLDSTVFFGEWVPYEDWQSVLLECDIALSLHHDSFETQLAFRSRVLEYFWAELPVIASRGDATSDLVTHYNLGRVVGYEDVDGVIQAVEEILKDSSVFQAGFAQARRDLTWENAAEPLIRFCQNPRRAADREGDSRLQLTHHERRLRELETLVTVYRSGKFMRIMRRIQAIRNRWKMWQARL